jgi:hypothetical protein
VRRGNLMWLWNYLMKGMSTFGIAVLSLLLSFSAAAKPVTQSDSPSAHVNGRVKGVILTLACEPLADARIIFTNNKWTQLITPERDGHFIVELPAGDYLVSVSAPDLGAVKSSALRVERGQDGELHLYVNTGFESTCPCFGPDVKDMLIPVEPVIINTQIQERRQVSKP